MNYKFVFAVSIFFLLSGCSYQYVDKKTQARHVIGFAHIVSKEVKEEDKEVIMQQVTTLGASFLNLPERSGLSLGYTRNFTVQVFKDDIAGEVSVDLNNPSDMTYKGIKTIIREAQRCPDIQEH